MFDARPSFEDARLDPDWWEDLCPSRAGLAPRFEDEDPRFVGTELGLLPPPRSPHEPPSEADFMALASALRVRAESPAHVRLGTDRRGRPSMIFRFPFDELLNLAVKRLPGRRFDWEAREWSVPCMEHTAPEVAEMLACFPRLAVAPAVSAWLAAAAGWHGVAAVRDVGYGPMLAVRSIAGTKPEWVEEGVSEERDGWLLLPLDAELAELAEEQEGLEIDDVAAASIEAVLGRGPAVAGAELDLGVDPEGVEHFELWVGTRVDARAAFMRLSEAHRAGSRHGSFALIEQRDLLAVPADPALLDQLDEFLDGNEYVVLTDVAARRREELRAERRRAKATVALSVAEDDIELELPALGGELRPFQRAGVRYAIEQRRTFLADEQGLGKTVQALAALEADSAYPAVVVCPASLKLTWEREAAHWLPHRTTAVLSGRSARGWERAEADQADIVILNYDIVGGHVRRLGERGLRAAVFDESHYCKEPRAKRTKACLSLARQVSEDGLRLALTGTPILNRPKELVSQLRLIGRLDDFGSGAAMTRRFRGSDALERLHWHLRSHCYVRRLKADVLPQLPPKRQVTIPVALSNETEYRLAERNVVDWLRAQPLDLRELEAKVAAALRNERLVQLNKLRQLAGRGKLDGAIAWLEDFVASGEPLVVFADHVELQQELVARFPGAVHVLGSDDARARDEAVRAFQSPDGPQVIVCSLRAAGQGLTLTRASNVAFLELDWTP
ncbi:MAG: SWI/SNF-related matrix-associated actin-dependent regulator of chromatin subfamily A-like protein 1, partial [Thermoleophilaceae bacterium]|nr:SWI/SNF-related matrix-associated actin-dependent regulator of chromatin subfamily A-like protein 1 [Thermoleophilaceae bacterium]